MINESNVASAKHISRALLATVIAFILIVCVFTISAFAGEAGQYNVIINDNGYEYTITTGETEPIEILNDANITLGSNDKLNIAAFSAGIGGKMLHGSIESATKEVHEAFLVALKDMMSMQHEIYQLMSEEGWYSTDTVSQTKLDQVIQKFSKLVEKED